MLAATGAGDPTAFVALAGIANDLRRVHERLERTAEAAEQDNQRLAVASLSSQQLQAAEVRAMIGGVGGYAPQKAPIGGEGQTFAVNFNFSGGRTEKIIDAPVIDAKPAEIALPIGRRPTLLPDVD